MRIPNGNDRIRLIFPCPCFNEDPHSYSHASGRRKKSGKNIDNFILTALHKNFIEQMIEISSANIKSKAN